MDNPLKGLPGVTVFLDDILVAGKTSEEHVHNLRAVLQRLSESGLKLRRKKCQFFLPAVEYLGLRITADGVQPTPSNVRAIKEAPRPKTVSELRSFLGLVNHYAKFLPHLAHHLTSLSDLLCADQDWVWGNSQEAAFCTVQGMISEDLHLSHYYKDRPLLMSCDVSAVGIGLGVASSLVLKDVTPRLGEGLSPLHLGCRNSVSTYWDARIHYSLTTSLWSRY